ncbi:unnamed protein product [Cercospora beticola]|nr:unnamed protein product [Cercospora beticola]
MKTIQTCIGIILALIAVSAAEPLDKRQFVRTCGLGVPCNCECAINDQGIELGCPERCVVRV